MSNRTLCRAAWMLAVVPLLGACEKGGDLAGVPDAQFSASRAGATCAVMDVSGSAELGVILPPLEGAFNLGALPSPFTVAGHEGTLYSYVTNGIPAPVGADGRGATLITLRHIFTSPAGSFYTDDRATCAPSPQGPGTCRISDQLTVAGGTGVFEGATGKLHNRGVIDFNTMTLTYHMTGRVCSAGL